jgi:type II secretory pathway pseudopilin PulG
MVIGVLAAIALPSVLNYRESKVRSYLRDTLHEQEVYYLEKQGFASSWDQLSLGVRPESGSYTYTIAPQSDGKSVMVIAQSKKEFLKGYIGAVFAVGDSPSTVQIYSQLCVSSFPGIVQPGMFPTLTSPTEGEITCAFMSSPVQ